MPFAQKKRSQKQAKKTPDAESRISLPLWKKALFSALTLVLFFGLIEFVLFVAGVQPITYEEDPYVGFSSQIPLFIEQSDGGDDQQMVTARNKLPFFNKQEFSKQKAGSATRVFCMGGSTTYGRPYNDATSYCGWLRELLPVADPSSDWEVINAGGISYASYRVAALMEELSDYQPDLFIIYCGQNEFLERRTYSGIIDTPAPIRGLGAMLSHTRTYSAATRLARSFGEEPASNEQPEQLAGEVEAILDKSLGPKDYHRDLELQEQVLAHYRYNLARIVDIARASGAKVVFVTPALNLRHCSPFKSQHRNGLNDDQKQQWDTLFQRARSHFKAQRWAEALSDLKRAAEIDDQYAELHYLRGRVLDRLQRYEESKVAYQRALDEDVCPLRALSPMRTIVTEVARERDVPLVDFATLVENESPQSIPGEELFLDHVHPTIDGHRMLALAIIDEMSREKWIKLNEDWNDAAVERVASGIMQRVDPKAQAVAMRNLSKVFSWAGKKEDAYRAAKKALELYPGDAETHYQLGALAKHLGETEEAVERLTYLISFDLTSEVGFYLKAHVELAAILIEQGDYAQCERVLQRLIQLDPDNAFGQEQWRMLLALQGQQLIDDGKFLEAAAKLREVVRLQPENVDAKIQLAVALIRAGDYKSSATVLNAVIAARPEYLAAYDNLSFVLAQLGQLDEAEAICRRALEIDPNHAPARKNLQLILRRKSRVN